MKENNKPSIKQWTELYDIAMNIRQIEPWDYLWDMDHIVIKLPDRKEPIYCSVMGRKGECYAIGVYPGFSAIGSLYRMANAAFNETASHIAGLEQECLICHFGNREEVEQEDREVYKALGLRFRGRNEWIYFRTMEPGYYPWYISASEADLLIQVLQNLALAVSSFINGETKVHFRFGEALVRSYSQKEGLWRNEAARLPLKVPTIPRQIVDDEVLIARLLKCERIDTSLEFDFPYLPMPIQENRSDRPFLPRFLLLMSKDLGIVIDQKMLSNEEAFEENILDMLKRFILKYGRPSSIYIRDNRTSAYIGDLCKKVKIKIIEGKGVPEIDDFISDLIDSFC